MTTKIAFADVSAPLEISEEDNSPRIYPWGLRFANGTVTLSNDGTALIDASTSDPTYNTVTVQDEAYDATGWNSDLTVPTKNAVRDKFESFSTVWQSTSNVINQVTSSDNVTVGSSTSLGKLAVDGRIDQVQLLVQANETQTNKIFVVEDSTGSDLFSISLDGTIAQTGTPSTSGIIDIGSAGVQIQTDGDGALTTTGLGDGFDESITANYDDTLNTVVWSTTTNVGSVDTGSIGFNLDDATIEIPNSDSLPSACVVGQIYMDTDATSGQRIYACESTNSWVLQGGSSVSSTPVALTDASTIATDASQGNTFTVTLGGNRTLGQPTNPTDGQKAIWIFSQDNTGSRTIQFHPVFRFGTTVVTADISTTAGSHSYVGAIYRVRGTAASAISWDVVSTAKGYAS